MFILVHIEYRKRDEAGRSDSEEDDTGSLSEDEDASEDGKTNF